MTDSTSPTKLDKKVPCKVCGNESDACHTMAQVASCPHIREQQTSDAVETQEANALYLISEGSTDFIAQVIVATIAHMIEDETPGAPLFRRLAFEVADRAMKEEVKDLGRFADLVARYKNLSGVNI